MGPIMTVEVVDVGGGLREVRYARSSGGYERLRLGADDRTIHVESHGAGGWARTPGPMDAHLDRPGSHTLRELVEDRVRPSELTAVVDAVRRFSYR